MKGEQPGGEVLLGVWAALPGREGGVGAAAGGDGPTACPKLFRPCQSSGA